MEDKRERQRERDRESVWEEGKKRSETKEEKVKMRERRGDALM